MSKARTENLQYIARHLTRLDARIKVFTDRFANAEDEMYALNNYGEKMIESVCEKVFWKSVMASLDLGESFRTIYETNVERVMQNACYTSNSSSTLSNLLKDTSQTKCAGNLKELLYYAEQEDKEAQQEKEQK